MMVLGIEYANGVRSDWLRVRRMLMNAKVNDTIPIEKRAYLVDIEFAFFIPPDMKLFKDKEGNYYVLLPELKLRDDFDEIKRFFKFKE